MKALCSSIVLLLLVALVSAQTETVVNLAGATVVEVITQDPAGDPTTVILATVASSASTPSLLNPLTSSTPLTTSNPLLQTTTTTPAQIGPVGAPAPTPVAAGGPTPFTYTTVNADGETVQMQGIFTPTGPATVLPSPTTTGTILNYSQWRSLVGTYTVPVNAATRVSARISAGWYCLVATTLTGLAGGAWLVL